VEAGSSNPDRIGVVFGSNDTHELRYSDMRRMGRLYLTDTDQLDAVPQFAKLGPDVMAIDEEPFTALIAKRRGQIKDRLTHQESTTGIGNAYSDELLWEAKLHTHRKRSIMDDVDIHRLFESTRTVIECSCTAVDQIVQT
jgi:formamidopyrimidine-DNA glycosylase